jgi:hypothetical protein
MPVVSPRNIHTKCTKRALLVMISSAACGVLSCVHKYISPVVYSTLREKGGVRLCDCRQLCLRTNIIVMNRKPEIFTDYYYYYYY